MGIVKNDFIEIEFTGRITETGEVFDTNIEADAKLANFDLKDIKPFKMSVGHKMLPEGFEEDLLGKEIGKDYVVEINPDKAFGKRNPQMIRMVATKLFHQQKINPERGMQLNLDGQLVKILSSSGGRTLVDFNNPLSGKKVTYEYKILGEVKDQKERIDAIQEFMFRQNFEYEIAGEAVKFKVPKEFEPLVKMFGEKFEEILGLKVETEVVDAKKEEKKVEGEEKKKEEDASEKEVIEEVKEEKPTTTPQ